MSGRTVGLFDLGNDAGQRLERLGTERRDVVFVVVIFDSSVLVVLFLVLLTALGEHHYQGGGGGILRRWRLVVVGHQHRGSFHPSAAGTLPRPWGAHCLVSMGLWSQSEAFGGEIVRNKESTDTAKVGPVLSPSSSLWHQKACGQPALSTADI